MRTNKKFCIESRDRRGQKKQWSYIISLSFGAFFDTRARPHLHTHTSTHNLFFNLGVPKSKLWGDFIIVLKSDFSKFFFFFESVSEHAQFNALFSHWFFKHPNLAAWYISPFILNGMAVAMAITKTHNTGFLLVLLVAGPSL